MEPMNQVLNAVLKEIDADCDGQLGCQEFEQLMYVMRSREGFTKEEDEMMTGLFTRFDWQKNGSIPTMEFGHLLSWLGFWFPEDDIHNIVAGIDVDSNGTIDYSEFRFGMRKFRELEIKMLRKAIEDHHAIETTSSMTKTLSHCKDSKINSVEDHHVEELESFLTLIGYMPNRAALKEVLKELSGDLAYEMNLNHVWDVLQAYRAAEGFTKDQSKEVQEAFHRYDVKHIGEIGDFDVGKALRWFGYPVHLAEQHRLVELVDVDRSGKLDMFEFRKLIRVYWDRELQKMSKVFNAKSPNSAGQITLKDAHDAYVQINFVDSFGSGHPPSVPSEYQSPLGYVDLSSFTHVGSLHRQEKRDHYRMNGGYSAQEKKQIDYTFKQYDADGSGTITHNELGRLIMDLFPCMTLTLRHLLEELMRETTHNTNGNLDFQEFIRMMRQFQDIQSQEKANKELQVIEETGFSQDEVKDFKEMFLTCLVEGHVTDTDECDSQLKVFRPVESPEIELCDVCELLASISPIVQRQMSEVAQVTELQTAFKEATKKYWTSPIPHNTIDFPEFLWLMERLLKMDFAGIKQNVGWKSEKTVEEVDPTSAYCSEASPQSPRADNYKVLLKKDTKHYAEELFIDHTA